MLLQVSDLPKRPLTVSGEKTSISQSLQTILSIHFRMRKKSTLGNNETPLQRDLHLVMRTGMGRRQQENGNEGGDIREIKVTIKDEGGFISSEWFYIQGKCKQNREMKSC